MKYLKLYESFDDIYQICRKYDLDRYTINQDGSVDVNGDVDLSNYNLKKIPLMFNKVSGHFTMFDNKISSLKGSPKEIIGGDFTTTYNNLTTLEYGPKIVSGVYRCKFNKLVNLHGFPEYFDPERSTNFYGNHVYEILDLVLDQEKFIKWLNEYDVIRDGNKIVEMRLEEAYWMTTKKELPMDKRKFKNYTLI